MLLDKIRETLRITHNKLDNEIQDMIEACKNDMIISGISKIDEEDPLVLQAIKVYCKREYESDMNKRDRYDLAYDNIIKHMGLTKEYGYDVPFVSNNKYEELSKRLDSVDNTVESVSESVKQLETDTFDTFSQTIGVIDSVVDKLSNSPGEVTKND